MKKHILVLVAVLITVTMFAQVKTSHSTNANNDTIKFNLKNGNGTILFVPDKKDSVKNKKIDSISIAKKKKFDGHWSGLEFGVNGYLNNNKSFNLNSSDQYLNLNQAKSYHFSFNFAERNIPIIKNHLGLVSGLGLQFSNYRFENNINLVNDSAKITFNNETDKSYEKNKLVVTNLTVPLLLELQLPINEGKDNLHISGGIIGGLRLGAHTKQVFEVNGHKNKEKQREDYHLSPFSYSATARVGYNNVSLFMNCDLASLFKTNEGPVVYPWSAGISLSF